MSESDANLVLDANAAAGLLQEIFVGDATIARIQCAPTGAVLRCSHCAGVLIRAVHTPHGLWLDMAGWDFPSTAPTWQLRTAELRSNGLRTFRA